MHILERILKFISSLLKKTGRQISVILSLVSTPFRNAFAALGKFWKKEESVEEPVHEPEIPEKTPETPKQYEEHACKSYMELKLCFRDIGRLFAIAETLGRDYLTAMPEGASERRLGQISFLYKRMHEDLLSGSIEDKIADAHMHLKSNPQDWDEWDEANLREMQSYCAQKETLSTDLIEQQAVLSYNGRRVHRDCLLHNDWKTAREFLKKTVDLHIEIAERKCRAVKTNSPYEALIQDYMPGVSVSKLNEWFGELETGIKAMIPEILQKQEKENSPIAIDGKYPASSQMWLNRCLLQVIGFDFKRGGLYETGHNPVEGGTPEDTRLVIKTVDGSNFLDSMKSALHEGGHGIYIQGLPRTTWRYQPVAQDLGSAIHESQALLIEMLIGRTKEFFAFVSPRLEGLYHKLHDPALSCENLYKLKTRVKPGPQRKSADEVTYFLHVLMRKNLEKRLIEGELKVEDLPDAWNEQMQEHLDVIPETHKDGILQDVHWFVGKFGYFPAYTIGHMISAQLFEKLNNIFPDLRLKIMQGQFEDIKVWLNENIHGYGRLYPMHELIKKATGKPVSTRALIAHLENRYLKANI